MRKLPFLSRQLAAAARCEAGLAAVEFAFFAPVALAAALGTFLASQGYQVATKAESAASEITDIVSQQATLTSAQLQTILNVSAAILTPYDSSGYLITVSQIAVDASGTATVDWSRDSKGGGLTKGSTVTLPSGVGANSSYLIYATASYDWKPPIKTGYFDNMTFSKTVYRSPRIGTSIPLN